MVDHVSLASTTVVLNHFAEGSKSRPTILLESRTKKIYHKSIDTFCFIALTKSVTQILEVLLKDIAYRKESFPTQESDSKLRAGLKGRGARGNFYWRATVT